MEKLGYQILVTILLPGALLLAAIWLAFGGIFLGSHAFLLVERVFEQEWVAGGAILLASSLLGTLLGSVLDSLESYTYDVWAARDMQLTEDAYWEEWLKFVDSLAKTTNPFIDQMALYFFFESRTAVASIVLGVTWALVSWHFGEFAIAATLIVIAVVLFAASVETHRVLADYRHRHFSSPDQSTS
jgi:hypothetical protein